MFQICAENSFVNVDKSL